MSAKVKPAKANQELESNAEYQRRRVMTKDEIATDARDRVAKNLHDQNVKDNRGTTYEDAQRKAAEIANKVHREKQERGER